MKKKDESLFSLVNIQQQYVECRRHKRNTKAEKPDLEEMTALPAVEGHPLVPCSRSGRAQSRTGSAQR